MMMLLLRVCGWVREELVAFGIYSGINAASIWDPPTFSNALSRDEVNRKKLLFFAGTALDSKSESEGQKHEFLFYAVGVRIGRATS